MFEFINDMEKIDYYFNNTAEKMWLVLEKPLLFRGYCVHTTEGARVAYLMTDPVTVLRFIDRVRVTGKEPANDWN